MSLGSYVVDAKIGDSRRMLRGLEPIEKCVRKFGTFLNTVPNGTVGCDETSCYLDKCRTGFHRLKTKNDQAKKAKCISNFNGVKWNKERLLLFDKAEIRRNKKIER